MQRAPTVLVPPVGGPLPAAASTAITAGFSLNPAARCRGGPAILGGPRFEIGAGEAASAAITAGFLVEGRAMERGAALLVPRLGVGAGSRQRLDSGRVFVKGGRQMQRSPPALVSYLGVGSGSQQRLDNGGIVVKSGCQMQGKPTVFVARHEVRSGGRERGDDGGAHIEAGPRDARGVQPFLLRALGSAPASSSAAMTAGLALKPAAKCRGGAAVFVARIGVRARPQAGGHIFRRRRLEVLLRVPVRAAVGKSSRRCRLRRHYSLSIAAAKCLRGFRGRGA